MINVFHFTKVCNVTAMNLSLLISKCFPYTLVSILDQCDSIDKNILWLSANI